ncbi:MAG: DUF4861 family protein [Alistipes sp.]
MKNIFLFVALLLLQACSAPKLTVEVNNETRFTRAHETVEIAWSEIATLKGVTPKNVIVTEDAKQIPSQVIYHGQDTPQSLIFQANVDTLSQRTYIITIGEREAYPTKVFGRYVPERKDDYAWENDKIAYRLYGPALESELSAPGIDVWLKSTDRLILDERYAKNDYHHDHGDGMDCYKVGPTLGAGASAPYLNDTLWLSHNYATQQTLDNGPIRTTVKLTYSAFNAAGIQVSLTKYISLDAYSRFNRMENVYTGDFEILPVAAGFVRHDVKDVVMGPEWLMMFEAASDTDDPVRDGDIYLGIILPGAEFLRDASNHALALTTVEKDKPMVYYVGSGWSQGGIENVAMWIDTLIEQTAAVVTPLQVKVVR